MTKCDLYSISRPRSLCFSTIVPAHQYRRSNEAVIRPPKAIKNKAYSPILNLKHVWVLENIASHPFRMGSACYVIVLVGSILNALGVDTALERSGAVLIILVLYFIYLNHFVSVESKRGKEFLNATSHLKKRESAITQFKRQSSDISDDQAIHFADSIINTRNYTAKVLPDLSLEL